MFDRFLNKPQKTKIYQTRCLPDSWMFYLIKEVLGQALVRPTIYFNVEFVRIGELDQ